MGNTEVTGRVAERARQEADAYRGDNARPLEGYAVVLGIYGSLVALTAVVAAATGRKLPARWPLQDLVTVAIGTHKLSRTVSKDAVTSPLRAPFTRFREAGAPGEVNEEVRGDGPRKAIGELLSCPFCIGQWIATTIVGGLVLAPRTTRWIAATLTVAAAAESLQYVHAALDRATD